MEATLIKTETKYGIVNPYFVPNVLKKFIKYSLPGFSHEDISWYASNDYTYVKKPESSSFGVGNLGCINGLRRINKHFEAVNNKLKEGQFFVACLETQDQRKVRILQKYPKVLNKFMYIVDFLFHRVFAKVECTKKIYFALTKGSDRVLSLTEALGRLSSCGFQIISYQKSGYRTYVIAKKTNAPKYDMEPTYGALVKLKRKGKAGELICVYKFRTMHPYSEYIQDFVYEMNSLNNGGKLKDDFRVTTWGRIFRKFWIDEIPMFINVFKGEMKIVGVRPLSQQYFSLYPKDMQEFRTKFKPGLVPPFYADLPKSFAEIVMSEKKYLEEYSKRPIRTDIKYFYKSFYNIIVKKIRSA